MSTLSLEPLHLYNLWTHELSQEASKLQDRDALRFLQRQASSHIERSLHGVVSIVSALVAGLEAGSRVSDLSICFLIDDHFRPRTDSLDLLTSEWVANRLTELWIQESSAFSNLKAMPDPVIVAESALADASLTQDLIDCVSTSPRLGAGSPVGSFDDRKRDGAEVTVTFQRGVRSYLETDTRSREAMLSERSTNVRRSYPSVLGHFAPSLGEISKHSGIYLACELFVRDRNDVDQVGPGTGSPTCSLLAASWQLYRMNWRGCQGSGAAGDTLRGEMCPADRTLSILPASLISVEHSVRSILTHSGDPSSSSSDDEISDLIDRIAYFFVPDDWYS